MKFLYVSWQGARPESAVVHGQQPRRAWMTPPMVLPCRPTVLRWPTELLLLQLRRAPTVQLSLTMMSQQRMLPPPPPRPGVVRRRRSSRSSRSRPPSRSDCARRPRCARSRPGRRLWTDTPMSCPDASARLRLTRRRRCRSTDVVAPPTCAFVSCSFASTRRSETRAGRELAHAVPRWSCRSQSVDVLLMLLPPRE